MNAGVLLNKQCLLIILSAADLLQVAAMEITEGQPLASLSKGTCGRACASETPG